MLQSISSCFVVSVLPYARALVENVCCLKEVDPWSTENNSAHHSRDTERHVMDGSGYTISTKEWRVEHLLARSWSSLWLFFFYLYSQIFSWHIQYLCSSVHQGQYFHLDLQIDIHSLNVLFPGKPASQDWLPKIQTSRDYLNFKQEGAPLTIDEAIVFDGPMLVCTFACKNYICHSYWLWTSLISPRRVSQGLSQSPLNVFKCSSSMFVEHTVHSVSRVKQQHGSLFPRSLAQSLGCIPKH